MKKIKLFSALLALVVFTACDKDDENINNVYDDVNGQTGVGFTTSGTSVSVKPEGAVVTLGVQSTVTTTSDRNYDVMVNEVSTGSAGHYSIGNITIPSGSYDGLLTVNMIDDGTLLEGVSYDLVLDLDLPADVAVHTSKTATITYNKYQLCNDYVLTLNEDDGWGSERTWDITDDTGAVVQSGGPYTDGDPGPYVESFNLADGCYTITLYDSFGDGQWNGAVAGSYSLDCGISNAASGGNNWGSSESTDFCVNP